VLVLVTPLARHSGQFHPEVTPAAKVAALSGIITQFIGATFLVIHRSTMAQANEFMTVLERINTVGMAVQVLDSIPETNAALKDKTRAEIVRLLLSTNTPPRTNRRASTDKPKSPA
jgi:TRADD-N domain-containing protein